MLDASDYIIIIEEVSTHVISWIAIMSTFLSALDYIVKESVSVHSVVSLFVYNYITGTCYLAWVERAKYVYLSLSL